MYADGAGSIVKACRIERINLEESQPGVPQSNGVIERANGDIVSGTRALMMQAGLPDCFWRFAASCYCHHENITVDTDGESPYINLIGCVPLKNGWRRRFSRR